eukprot:TRINITY_DN18515_c0_g1::TRINITY_DN18515_c0_g1_i1::g.2833::m.2833 TRINITY_DN18515_c0_g1::TRINITY_DN18515_c0_g1_i1::g.2833  ORF type:complete len:293 (-),score=34.77,sp/Q93075/TATD2_HUMAN/40.22/2e-56,TatD_DNase/PF01026.16/6.3e-62 TRINITY_DN18515_c0_g1_i1:729-1607(-)
MLYGRTRILTTMAKGVKDVIMRPYVDTHCHLDMILQKLSTAKGTSNFKGFVTIDDFMATHIPPECDGMLTVSCDATSVNDNFEFMKQNPKIYGAFGCHPHNAKNYTNEWEKRIEECLKHERAVAWGECGLDFHYNHSPRQVQLDVFVRQMKKAVELRKPLVVHTREAEEDTLRLMKETLPVDHPIHVHCFTDSAQLAQSLLSSFSNLYIGFTGACTFKTATALRETIKTSVPLHRILLETDGPYMAPVPFRGDVANPGHIPYIAKVIAEVKEVPVEKVFEQARENTRCVYGI